MASPDKEIAMRHFMLVSLMLCVIMTLGCGPQTTTGHGSVVKSHMETSRPVIKPADSSPSQP